MPALICLVDILAVYLSQVVVDRLWNELFSANTYCLLRILFSNPAQKLAHFRFGLKLV